MRNPNSGADSDTEVGPEVEKIVVGWNPNGDETAFALSPTKFCQIHKLAACQAGIVRFLSRYQFEKNPWLLDQASLLAQLLLESGRWKSHSTIGRLRKRMGFESYMAPRVRAEIGSGISVSTYCLVNGIAPKIVLLIGLICNAPTEANIERAIMLMSDLKAARWG